MTITSSHPNQRHIRYRQERTAHQIRKDSNIKFLIWLKATLVRIALLWIVRPVVEDVTECLAWPAAWMTSLDCNYASYILQRRSEPLWSKCDPDGTRIWCLAAYWSNDVDVKVPSSTNCKHCVQKQLRRKWKRGRYLKSSSQSHNILAGRLKLKDIFRYCRPL